METTCATSATSPKSVNQPYIATYNNLVIFYATVNGKNFLKIKCDLKMIYV
jgi:hypothetical protein